MTTEVPGPGDPNGHGEAVVKVYKARVCYTLMVRRIKPAMAAHIHRGCKRGGRSHSRAQLNPPTDGSSSGCEAIPRALSMKLRQNPGRYYVNVHNKPYPRWGHKGPATQKVEPRSTIPP